MRYLGGKSRLAGKLCPILSSFRKGRQTFVDLFTGGGHIVANIPGPRIACDIHPELIAMFQMIQWGWEPPSYVSEKDYREAMQGKGDPHLRGFIGFGCSYGGKWFGGYARGEDRNYALETKTYLLGVRSQIQNVHFVCSDYRDLSMPPGALIYADKPYQNTTKYKADFDHEAFWEWGRSHPVLVSEFTAPKDYVCVWSLDRKNQLCQKRSTVTEHLFASPSFLQNRKN